MNDQTDAQLLRDYATHRSEPAFAELVRRHVDLVHSAAQRMVGDAHLAGDVTQRVFLALAQNAAPLAECAVLSSWLHRTARNIAAQTVRTDVRRRAREQEAAAMNEIFSTESESSWEQIAPHLDAALGELSEVERDAILLRYFEKKSALEIAAILGITGAAAQKRVNRGVERLREFFSKRKVTIGVSGLAALISANAVQAAPVGLAVTISAAAFAGTAVSTSTVIAATKIIAMTTIQKALVTATVVVLAGAGIFEARQAAQLREQNQTLQQQQAPLADQIQQLQHERDDVTNQLASLLAENAQLKSNSNENELLKLRGEVTRLRDDESDQTSSAAKAWLDKVNKLKQQLEENPGARIPEMQFLTEQDWLNAASKKLKTDADYRRALAALRSAAENKFAGMYQQSLQRYLNGNSNQFPTDVSQLQSYFDPPIDEAILQRWKFVPANGNADQGFAGGNLVLTEKAPVDELFDSRYTIGLHGSGSVDSFSYNNKFTIGLLQKAFFAANPPASLPPSHPPIASELLPYATTPEQQAVVQQMMLRESALK